MAIDLCVVPPRGAGESATCWGALVLDLATGAVTRIAARVTVLATGGAGKVYLYTTNPDIATGDGVAMAFRAGALVANMEFFQFHPTCLYHPQAKSFLISESLRGEGAVLRRPDGTTFMAAHHPQAELAPRDIVAHAIDSEMKTHGFSCVYLDIRERGADFIRRRFPNIYRRCRELGIDIACEPIPVVPAAHYCCGGIVTDTDGATSLHRLYACGEAAMTGLHGGNRLASNSLLEAVVFGHRAADHAARLLAADPQPPPPLDVPPAGRRGEVKGEMVGVSQNWQTLRRLMWNYVGVVRSEHRLARAAERIRLIRAEAEEDFEAGPLTGDVVEMRQLATVAELIVTAARFRRESRGLHFLTDHPEPDDRTWRCDTLLDRDAHGRVTARRGPPLP